MFTPLNIYGNDYQSPDGNCMRGYIHVMDLAGGCLAELDYARNHFGWDAIGLGAGITSSILDVVSIRKQISGDKISISIIGRRTANIGQCSAKVDKSYGKLQWWVK